MAKTAQDVMQLIREQGIKMVDFKMVDINGQYRHVTIPAQNFTEATMTDGIGFDASNYGYAVVEKSDMVFIPDPATAQIDPFCEVSTLSMTGNAMIIDYPHNRPLDQYPRNIVLAAEQYMRDTGIADTMLILPEFEFYLFDDVAWKVAPNEIGMSLDAEQAHWNGDINGRGVIVPRQGHYHIAKPLDRTYECRSEMCLRMEEAGIPIKYHHPEVGGAGQFEIEPKLGEMSKMADATMLIKYIIHNTALKYGKSATFMPKPVYGEAGSGMHVHMLLMTPPMACLVIFTILPLLYMMSMAFTNYSKEGDHLVLFDWVGLKNFMTIFDSSSVIGKQFGSVLLWTLIWAFFATFLNFFLGTIVALIINRPAIKFKSFWRGCLSMTIAVPQFVSLMVVRSMVQPEGIVNKMLLNAGWISQRLPFLENVTWARVLVIVVNLWVGIPYTIMQVTGILQNIPADQYEEARIDGANAFQQFTNITLPYMLFVMTPYLITQFTGNINNFNVIYLLTRGEPMYVGNSAGGTDLLVTWLYKLSVDQQKYNLAAVIGIFTFVVLSIVSLVTYRSSGSYKDEEGFK